MGCCQNSHCSFEEQITLEPMPKQGQMNSLKIPNRLPSLKKESFRVFPNPADHSNFYSIHKMISSSTLFSRFSCVHGTSSQKQELLLFKKCEMSETEALNLLQSCEKLSNFKHEHLVRVFSVSENEEFIYVFTEVCGDRTLKVVLENNRMPVGPALALARQMMQGLLNFQKLGISSRSLTENDVFLIKNSLKISISATILKDCEIIPREIQESHNPEVWCLGVILLQLLTAPSRISSIHKGLEKLTQIKVQSRDLKFLRKMLRNEKKRPLLQEVIHYNWSGCDQHQKFFEDGIEKISEECESFSWPESEEISDCCCNRKPQDIEKSTTLQTMESLSGTIVS